METKRSARNSVVGYFGRDSNGNLRAQCVCCLDKEAPSEAERNPIYGDLYVASGPRDRVEADEACETCGVTFLSLSERCQAEYEEQQAEFARGPITHVTEMGMPGFVRCRIY